MGKKSRRKGKRAENEIVPILRQAWLSANSERTEAEAERLIRRGLQGQGDATGERVPDVVAPGLWVESKRRKEVHPGDWLHGLTQAFKAAETAQDGRLACCWYRSDYGRWNVAVRNEELLRLSNAACPLERVTEAHLPVHMDGEDFAQLWAEWEVGR